MERVVSALRHFPLNNFIQVCGIPLCGDRHTNDSGRKLNFFLFAATVLTFNSTIIPNNYTAQEVFDKCKTRAAEIDSSLKNMDIKFTQKIEFESRGGNTDSLVFRITIMHGKFERQLISTTVPNGDRFNGGYDAFDKMFFLSEYFSGKGETMASCEFKKPDFSGCYEINFVLSNSADKDDPMNTVFVSLTGNDFTPVHIKERVNGLPLGAEFDDDINISYDKNLDICYPENITMRVYARLFFLKGEIAVVKIKNENLKKI